MLLKTLLILGIFVILCIPIIVAALRDKPRIIRVSGIGISVKKADPLLEVRLYRKGYYKQIGGITGYNSWFKPSPKNKWKREF